MQDVKVNEAVLQPRSNKFVSLAIILIILIAAGLVLFRSYQSQSGYSAANVISQSALEEKYGMRVNLVAVTGAGGFVDVRIRIVDGDKAKLLLSDAKNFPALSTASGVILNAPEDTKSQKIRFEDGGTMYIMYPNSGNAVVQGSAVTILFGETALEPMDAK